MPTKLKRLKIVEGSLVDKGANPDADVVLFKRASNAKGGEMNKAGRRFSSSTLNVLKEAFEGIKGSFEKLGQMLAGIEVEKGVDSMPISEEVLKGLPDEVKTHLEELQKAQDEFDVKLKEADKSDEIEVLTKKNEELTKSIDESKTDKDERTEIEKAMEGASEEAKKQFEAINERVEKAETIAKEERETRIAKEYKDKASEFDLVGDADKLAKTLRVAYESDEETGKDLEETLKSAQAKIKESGLLKEAGGTGGTSANSPYGKIEALAKEIVQKDSSVSLEEAIDKVMDTDEGAKLYKQHTEAEVN